MKLPDPIGVDFETDPIRSRPHYPPKPCGVSIEWPGKAPKYYSWGHPTGNNCTYADAKKALTEAWKSGKGILCHHSKFDLEVAEKHFGLPIPEWEKVHDTMYLLFLHDPHAPDLRLKPSAERLLDMPPEELDILREWLVENGLVPKGRKDVGEFISQAPGTIAGNYAKGDLIRTRKLFKLLYPSVCKRGMQPAYERERKLMPILLRNEQEGVRVDMKRLTKDYTVYLAALQKVDAWLRKRLKTPHLNVDSNDELADALDAAGIVTEWVLTPTGKRSTSKENMGLVAFKDKRVAGVLQYRTKLATCLGTFMGPWVALGQQTDGLVHTGWNQVRQSSGYSGGKGTRTGRLSSGNPLNFQNIPLDFYDKGDGYAHPTAIELPELPFMRDYVLPDKDSTILCRDYNQQELRLLAHFEEGALRDEYNKDANLDVHAWVGKRIKDITGVEYERRKVKITNFGILYGYGLGALAKDMKCSVDEAKAMKKAHATALPDVADLEKSIKQIGKDGGCIVTWGGREYYTEPPVPGKYGRDQTFEYKLLNYLIQGSASDVTKESIIRYDAMKKHGRFLITVHDENNVSCPKGKEKEEMKILKEAMEDMPFDVPMKSDGESGKTWQQLKPFKGD